MNRKDYILMLCIAISVVVMTLLSSTGKDTQRDTLPEPPAICAADTAAMPDTVPAMSGRP